MACQCQLLDMARVSRAHLEAHAMDIVQRIYQAIQVAAVSHLIRVDDMLKLSRVDIVVCRVTIRYSVQKKWYKKGKRQFSGDG
jgi:hypothetical protein